MEEIMLTKLVPPSYGTRLLTRKRLLQLIKTDNGNSRFLIITAPAGYGKTVFAQQLSQSFEQPLVWLQLDRHDNDPAAFLHCLVTGLRQHWPELGNKAIQLAAQGGEAGNNPRLVVSILVNDLLRYRANPVLVFDDTHELNEPSVLLLLKELLDNLPSGIFSILAGRTAIPLKLNHYYTTGKAHHLGAAELSFTNDEIRELLQERYGPQPNKIVKEVERLTGGWPVTIEFSDMLLPEIKSNREHLNLKKKASLFDYLASEVLEKQLPEHRKFLLESSVLETLSPDLCDQLLNRNDSKTILTALNEQHNLLIPLAGIDNTYRIHHLLRFFFLQKLGSKRCQLQRQAGRHAEAAGDFEAAIDYYLQAGFDTEAEKLLVRIGRETLASGRWHKLVRWLEQLNDEKLTASAWLSYFSSAVEVYRGRLIEAELWIEKATTAFMKTQETAGLIECRLLQARILRSFGRYRESLDLLEQIATVNEGETKERFDLILEIGYNLFLLGEMPKAEDFLMGALVKVRETGNIQAAIYLTEALGNICYQQGKHTRAMKLYQWCQRNSESGSLPGYYIQDAMPYIYCDWGELDKALELAAKELALKEKYEMLESLPSAYSTLAYVYFEMADYKKTEELIRKALNILYEHGEERFYLLINEMVLAWCRLAQGHWVEARHLIGTTLSKAENQVDQVCSMIQMLAGTGLALMGSLSEAEEILKRSEETLERMNFRIRLCECYKALAYISYSTGEMSSFQKYARKYLHLGARMNYINNKLHFTGQMLEPIFRFSMEQDIETLYVQKMMTRMGSHSHKLLIELSGHQNPAVRQRIIAPLTELADTAMLESLKKLARDKTPDVRLSAQSYLRLIPGTPYETTSPTNENHKTGPTLEIRTLGSLQFYADGKEITGWRTRKTRELISLLAHIKGPVSKERLQEELWPDLNLQSSSSLFGTTVYYLRQRLKQEGLTDLLIYQQGLYSLKPGSVEIDAVRFEELVATGTQQEPLQEVGAALLGKAVRLYKGDYMVVPDDYSWAIPHQVRLKLLYIDTLLILAQFYFTRRHYSKAQSYLVTLKETDPLCEQAHLLLLKVYARNGRYNAIIEEHRNFKLLLMEETGLAPADETEALYQQLLANK